MLAGGTCLARAVGAQAAGSGGSAPALTRFTVRVENVSKPSALRLSTGGAMAIPVSPGVWAVHTGGNPIMTPGQVEAGLGLKGLAEAGLAAEFAANLGGVAGVGGHGAFEKPLTPLITLGGMKPRKSMQAPVVTGSAAREPASRMLQPGRYFEFTMEARPGDRLSLAMMNAQSNDGLIASGAEGIALFDATGRPESGDVTGQLSLWDAGTEVNEEPGLGPNQGLRQGAPHAGDPERRPVRSMSEAEFGDRWPKVSQIVRVTLRVAPR
jgi:hypothetical protein